MQQDKPNFYAVIPADVRYDENIPPNAKLLYGEISALIGKEGFCYASNAYFHDTFGFSEVTVGRLVSQLEAGGYVKRVIDRDNKGQVALRKIYLTLSMPDVHPPINFDGTSPQNQGDPPLKIDGSTNTSNTNKENIKRKSDKRTPLTDDALRERIVRWIKDVAGNLWTREEKNAVYFALLAFYEPRETKKQEPARTAAAFTALSNRLLRYSGGDPAIMVDMLERATGAGWKSVFPIPGVSTADGVTFREMPNENP